MTLPRVSNQRQQNQRQYDDNVFNASRVAALKAGASSLGGRPPSAECIIISVDAYKNPAKWKITDLIKSDRRIASLMQANKIEHPTALQRFTWPNIEAGQFPLFCVAPENSGKTYCHILYMLAKSIERVPIVKTDAIINEVERNDTFSPQEIANKKKDANQLLEQDIVVDDHENFDFNTLTNQSDINANSSDEYEINADDFVIHPDFIVVCPTQKSAEVLRDTIKRLKKDAFDDRLTDSHCDYLPPKVRMVGPHNDDDKLAIKCHDSDILIGTPATLNKCFELKNLTFAKCKRVFFEDFDLTLQLNNTQIRKLVTYYVLHTNPSNNPKDTINCQMVLLLSKWTDLVKQFASTMFPQRLIIFRSFVEAAQYVGLKFEIEFMKARETGIEKLAQLVASSDDKMSIVCDTEEEAKKLAEKLEAEDLNVMHLPKEECLEILKSTRSLVGHHLQPTYIFDDEALEFASDYLVDVDHILHYSLPTDWSNFDLRFRLFYEHIEDEKKHLLTTIYIKGESTRSEHIKKLFDVVARSSVTSSSTRIELKNYMDSLATHFCWRWATMGVCRLDKLSRRDRFGSFCPGRHSLLGGTIGKDLSGLPTTGQFKISITHCVNPNEFYFRFESHRDFNSERAQWRGLDRFDSSAMEALQVKLDVYRKTPALIVPLDQMKKGKVFGVFFPDESKVCRVMLLEDHIRRVNSSRLNRRVEGIRQIMEYNQQVLVEKIDTGVRVSVFLRSLILLSNDLADAPRRCHRGFHVGIKPALDEPDWPYKATKQFEDLVKSENVQQITVWLLRTSGGTFWFEHMNVITKLRHFDHNNSISTNPYSQLIADGLAIRSTSLPFPVTSLRDITTQKWNADKLSSKASYAFLPKDHPHIKVQVLYIEKNLTFFVRIFEHIKRLVQLEREMQHDVEQGKLRQQEYLQPGNYSIVKIIESNDLVVYNRCKITGISEVFDKDGFPISEQTKYSIACLDHGDSLTCKKSDLFEITEAYLTRIPFQAIKCELADLDVEKLEAGDGILQHQIQDILYSLTRDAKNDLRVVLCALHSDRKGALYLYHSDDSKNYTSFIDTIENVYNLPIFTQENPHMREPLLNPDSDNIPVNESTEAFPDRQELGLSSLQGLDQGEIVKFMFVKAVEGILMDMAQSILAKM